MKALTVWQPWASMIVEGAKPYEFRRWSAHRSLIGQRIAIHAGARKPPEHEMQYLYFDVANGKDGSALDADKALPLIEGWRELPFGSAIGTAILGRPVLASELFANRPDSDRIDEHVWAWPMEDVRKLPVPIPARGAQGFWNWTPPPELNVEASRMDGGPN